MVELVGVDVKGDAGARMAELARCADGIDARPYEVARERMTKVMEPELWHSIPVERWQPTIIAGSADESTEGSASSDRRTADPSTVRPRLAEAAAESVEDIQRTLLDAATSASKPAWVEFECTDCGNRKRVEVPIPDVRARVAAIELLLREGLGRPAQAEEAPPCPNCPQRGRSQGTRLGSAQGAGGRLPRD